MICIQLNSTNGHARPVASIEDPELIQCMQAGCEECFSVFFRRYCKLVFAIALRTLRQTTEAEIIVQDVFFTIFLQTNPYDPDKASVRTWLAQFAHFKALQHRRRLNGEEYRRLGELTVFEQNVRQKSMRNIHESAILIEECLASLKSQQRRTLELVHFEGYTLAETAKLMGETLANTRNHYYRGLKTIRERLRVPSHGAISTASSQLERCTLELADGQSQGVHL